MDEEKIFITDEELQEILRRAEAKIKVVGIGGAGNNTIHRLREMGIVGAELIAVNTDAQHLLRVKADKKILIGIETTKGYGSGGDPKIGEAAAKESEHVLKKALEGADMVFITCGLGGGTGTGASPVIAEIAKKLGALTIGVVTLPFSIEGRRRMGIALEGLDKLRDHVDTTIVVPNDKLLEVAPDLPIDAAFKTSDLILANAIKGTTEIITKPGLVNVDFADVRAVLENGGFAVIGMGESDSENRAEEAVQKALSNPLLTVDITGAKGALIHIVGGRDLTLCEARTIVDSIARRLDPDAKFTWGALIENEMEKRIRVLAIITGVTPQEIKERAFFESKEVKKIEEELGIKFLE